MSDLNDIYIYDGDDHVGHRYQLRYAAGLYWLMEMDQSGTSYIPPLTLNEAGAQILLMFADGKPEGEICRWLCEKYEISAEQAQADVHNFIVQLGTKKVNIAGVRGVTEES